MGLGLAEFSPASASPYASDSFDYDLTAPVDGQKGGSGFGSAWSFTSTGSGVSATIVAGLSVKGLPSSSNAVQITAEEDGDAVVTGILGRAFGNTIPAASNLWGSFLVRQITQSAPTGQAGDFAISGTKFSAEGNRVYFVSPKVAYGSNLFFSSDIGVFKDAVASDAEFDLPLGDTFLVVYGFEKINYPAYTENMTTATYWVLDQKDVAAMDGSFTVEKLKAHHQSTATTAQKFEFGTPALTPTTPFELFAQNGTVIFDEIHLGTTLADVVPTQPSP